MRELHALYQAGKNDSDEADRVRDRMDEFWYKLTSEEVKRLNGLSADLFSLSENPANPVQRSKDAKDHVISPANHFEEAIENGEWDRALELLLEWKSELKPPVLSYWRGYIWKEAGDAETAELFLQHAAITVNDYPVSESATLAENSELLLLKLTLRPRSLKPFKATA